MHLTDFGSENNEKIISFFSEMYDSRNLRNWNGSNERIFELVGQRLAQFRMSFRIQMKQDQEEESKKL